MKKILSRLNRRQKTWFWGFTTFNGLFFCLIFFLAGADIINALAMLLITQFLIVAYYMSIRNDKKKSKTREWVDAIVFAVVAATIIRAFFLEAFTIPTSSEEKTLMIGDFLFVSKSSYGARLPMTPIAFPFAHHTMPLIGTKAYIEWPRIPYYRVPGFGKVKNFDAVVFNYPDGDTVALGQQDQSYYQLVRDYGHEEVWKENAIERNTGQPFGKVVARPVDKRENYIKRCVGIAGDTLYIKDRTLFINSKPALVVGTMQYSYELQTANITVHAPNFGGPGSQNNTEELLSNGGITQQILDDFDITEKVYPLRNGNFFITLPNDKVEKFKQLPFVKSLRPMIADSGIYDPRIFPHSPNYTWNVDNFGPLVIPKAGMTINIDTTNIVLYDRIIGVYEHNDLKVQGDKVLINGKEAKSYTFKMDYYWMMGDNRHNSADSRFWGFVPEDHIVGKAVFVWMSLKENTSIGKKFRWNRFFTFVNPDGLSRSYFVPFLIIVFSIILGFYLYGKRKKKA